MRREDKTCLDIRRVRESKISDAVAVPFLVITLFFFLFVLLAYMSVLRYLIGWTGVERFCLF